VLISQAKAKIDNNREIISATITNDNNKLGMRLIDKTLNQTKEIIPKYSKTDLLRFMPTMAKSE
jgi:hypothetical protein